MLVGRIIGKTSPEWFHFEVTNIIRKMDFIAVRDPERHWVLGRVEGLIQERDKTIASVSVIGYTDKGGVVKTPRMPFKPGSYVYRADDGLIKKVLGLKSSGFYIGLLEGSESLKVYLDPKMLITKHLAVLAKSGFGKSYFIGVLLEEFIENKIPAVVVDPHGEYMTLREPNKKLEEIKHMPKFGIKPKGYGKNVEIFCSEKNLIQGAKKLKFNGRLEAQEIFEMLPFRLTAGQLSIIYSVIKNAEHEKYTIEDIRKKVEKSKSRSKWNVLNVLDLLASSGLFDATHYVRPTDLVKSGKISIINMKGIDPDIQQLIVYKLVKDLFEARKQNKVQPFLLVLEEAHNFCPERGFGEAISSRILRTVASEGRKFGMGLAIVSQRSARVEKNVLSQCSTQVFLRVTNPNDLRTIMDSVEGITRGLEGEIKVLPVGTALVVGLIDQPLLVNIRVRRSEHTGAPMILPKKERKRKESDVLYFYPKFLEEDVKRVIKKRLEQYRLVYYPLWRLSCKFNTPEGEKIDNIFLDGLTGELVFLRNNRLTRTHGLTDLIKLGVKEKAVALFLTSYGPSTLDQISKKLRIKEKELENILSGLEKHGLISATGSEFKSKLDINFKEIIENQLGNELVGYKYSGELISFKVDLRSTDKVLELFSPDAVERKKCYYPFWFVLYEDGSLDVVDALTGVKSKYFVQESVEKF